MVVTAHPLATQVGVQVLKQGGNAVDAAVATGLALAVVYPQAGNIGGGGFMVIRFPDGSATSIDFREIAPLKAHKDMYLDSLGRVQPRKSRIGHLAAGVPGTLAGLSLAVESYGSQSFSSLIEPAQRLARDGFRLSKPQAQSLLHHRTDLQRYPATAEIFLKQGIPYAPGDTLRQTDLARTLDLIRQQGIDAFYRGPIADLIVADMETHGGLITHTDLSTYRAIERDPMIGHYKSYRIISMPPPSSGGIILLQMLNMFERWPLSEWGAGSIQSVHLMAEVMRRAFADRSRYMGDPDFVSVPIESLLDKTYLSTREQSISMTHASDSDSVQPGKVVNPGYESMETTHYSVADANGMAVSVTTTLNGSYGSLVTVPGAGFLLNNEMDDFTAKPDAPNMFGLLQGRANQIQPAKRMLSSMTPTIVEKNENLYLIVGSPGGPTIINTVLQVLLNTIEYGMSLSQAVAAPRMHHQWMPDRIDYESDLLSNAQKNRLESMGHALQVRNSIGNVQAICFQIDQNSFIGVSDPRGYGSAQGF
jgi:gamma-glutamyltranspeptidase/glutathione hydrolase